MKKLISVTLACIMMLLVFSACNSEKTQISIYFKDAQSNELNEEKRSVKADKKATAADLAKLAMAELIKGPQNEKNKPVISTDAKLISLAINDSVATVNMSKHYYNKKGEDALVLRFALINTLCAIDGIEGVVIQVEGSPITSESTGKELGVISKEDVSLSTEDNINVLLYFPDKSAEHLVAEERRVEATNSLSLEKTIVGELIKGPETDGLSPSLSPDTKLLGIEIQGSTCTVNFSSEFISKTSSGTSATTMALYSVVNSLCALENVENVQIQVDGETGVEFGNYVLDIPYESNDSIVK